MEVSKLREKLIALKREIDNNLENIASEMANNAKALANRNIVSKGVEGATYSDGLISSFFLKDKEINKKGKKFLVGKKESNWKQFRKAQGLQTAFVDLTYTGDMWAHTGVVRIVRDENHKVIALLGGTTSTAADKMGWNEDRYSNYIENNINPDDAIFIKDIANKKVREVIMRLNIIP